jgi:hypothetical protein
MSHRAAARLVWSLYGLVICLSIVWSGAGLPRQGGSRNALDLAGEALISGAAPVVFAIVAALIVSRQPRNALGWVMMVPVGLYVVGGPIASYIESLAPSNPEPTVPILLMAWFNGWNWLLLIIPLLFIMLLFPNGQPPTPRWRWVGVAAIVWAGLFVLLTVLLQQINAATTPNLVLDNPIGVLGKETVERLRLIGVWIVGLLALVVVCAGALFVRYRRANATEREQIKWLLYACALFLVVYVGGFVSGLGGSSSVVGYIWDVFFGLSVIALPAAIGIAILRYRLYDIDIIINRTLVYGLLTATLVALYFGVIVVLQRVFVVFTGQQSTLVVVASTLLIAALFNPLRRRIQYFIDRRFYRSKYDARKTLEDLSTKLRDETDLEALNDDLLGVVRETMHPAHVSLWLHPVAEMGRSRESA